jgi:hypothetical protein
MPPEQRADLVEFEGQEVTFDDRHRGVALIAAARCR